MRHLTLAVILTGALGLATPVLGTPAFELGVQSVYSEMVHLVKALWALVPDWEEAQLSATTEAAEDTTNYYYSNGEKGTGSEVPDPPPCDDCRDEDDCDEDDCDFGPYIDPSGAN